MNTSKLKAYAPQARRDFIAAVTEKAAFYGLTRDAIEPLLRQGEVALIGGRPFPLGVAAKRGELEKRIRRTGFDQVMEAMAYTWFNRFAALRYMELHGYLDHGYRILSHPQGKSTPEILEQAQHVDLPRLERDEVIHLKLEGTREEDLYRMLLIAQCNALHRAMPFLFERIGDETELLLPDNLLHSDSLIRKLVVEIPEDDWQEIEIIGWLYQFYISEKKDQVIGKVVKSEDIPAATQLFTPNWIVKYMVQNSLGAQWLATYPHSPLKGQMEYYIEPAEQTEEVKAQLAAITPSTLNPEDLTLIDPASGSGHILVEAYELFKAIYLERGYRQRDVAQLILEKNLFGLDIDGRAAQLTGFALMMKGRADDRRLLERGVKLNVMALVDSTGFDAEGLAKSLELADYDLQPGDLTELKRLFEHATTFGSLIQVPEGLAKKLPALQDLGEVTSQDLFVSDALKRLGPLVQQAELLAPHYDAVVANPPYMGSGGMNDLAKRFAGNQYPDAKNELFACFIERGNTLASQTGHNAMVTMQSWMFLSSFQRLRESLLQHASVASFVHNGRGVWGSDRGTCSFVLKSKLIPGYRGNFLRLFEKPVSIASNMELQKRFHTRKRFVAAADDFSKVPGAIFAYWVNNFSIFSLPSLSTVAESGGRTKTHKDERFVRMAWEVDLGKCGRDEKWIPYEKGGSFRKWFGERFFLVNWSPTARNTYSSQGGLSNARFWQKRGITWSDVTSGASSFRIKEEDAEYSSTSPTIFLLNDNEQSGLLSLLNSKPFAWLLRVLNPTLHVNPGDALSAPIATSVSPADKRGAACASLARADWNAYERSWDFQSLPILAATSEPAPALESSYTAWVTRNRETIAEMKRLEEENNRLFIDAYGLADELTPEVPIEQITLTVNPAYRYGGKLTEAAQWTRFRQDTMEELVSYAIGCMMGRYSLDAPGLIYAHSGNVGFDPSRYQTFPSDEDGIIPITDFDWFDDDAANRLATFIATAWPKENLDENLKFVAESLGQRKSESPRDTIRRYLVSGFYRHHLSLYKRRPIYWLFTSGKQRAFQCLVYLHRYNTSTLSRMRTEYVILLSGNMTARIDQLERGISAASSASHRRKMERERDRLIKQQEELQAFDEKLHHYADQRIELDLDDGVKVNYGKFGDLLAEVKAVTGKKPE